MKKSIAFVHLLNDYSGSPRVLRSVITSAITNGNEVRIIASQDKGFLSDIKGAAYSLVYYKFFKNKIFTLLLYILWQLRVFITILFLPKKFSVIYINTMHPFGASLAGLIRNNKIIYHIHETSIKPALFKKWLRWVIANSADEIIFVSKFLCDTENFPNKRVHVVYNALSEEFQNIKFVERKNETFEVLMLCSLKAYKGVDDFLFLAKQLPLTKFSLVLNTNRNEIDDYFNEVVVPKNVILHSSTRNVHPFYLKANLVINLSHPDQWIETFGMTIAEAFSYGIPVIVPEVGGIAELVEDKHTGYKLNHTRCNEICEVIKELTINADYYSTLRNNAHLYSKRFNIDYFSMEIIGIIES